MTLLGSLMFLFFLLSRWGEGTQIEPARDYGKEPGDDMIYMNLTKEWSRRFRTEERLSPQVHSNDELK